MYTVGTQIGCKIWSLTGSLTPLFAPKDQTKSTSPTNVGPLMPHVSLIIVRPPVYIYASHITSVARPQKVSMQSPSIITRALQALFYFSYQ